ncbi:molybdopterin-dependent oxidoreductase [Pseudomonas aeruginosa]|nr:molybdopterin-dependent oxidoreductase [Pseudomonas aeruginosa]
MRDYTPAAVADICGIDRADLQRCAEWIGRSPRFLSLWCMGLNQSSVGSAKNSALINLHLATGQDRPRRMRAVFLTGQPNAMGGRETGSLANLLPGHREAADPGHRAEVAHYWGVEQRPRPPVSAPSSCSMRSTTAGSKALWIACTNPAQSLPDQRKIHEALARCPFVVVQEAFAGTETCQYADLCFQPHPGEKRKAP